MDSLAIRTAEKHVQNYRAESELMAEHRQAMNCRDCEAFLKLGIDAFTWITYADVVMREAVFSGAIPSDANLDQIFAGLCEGWLKPCRQAGDWIAELRQQGYAPDNLEEFQKCCKEMEAIARFQRQTDEPLPAAMTALQERALEDHRHGKTAEIFSELESDN